MERFLQIKFWHIKFDCNSKNLKSNQIEQRPTDDHFYEPADVERSESIVTFDSCHTQTNWY